MKPEVKLWTSAHKDVSVSVHGYGQYTMLLQGVNNNGNVGKGGREEVCGNPLYDLLNFFVNLTLLKRKRKFIFLF